MFYGGGDVGEGLVFRSGRLVHFISNETGTAAAQDITLLNSVKVFIRLEKLHGTAEFPDGQHDSGERVKWLGMIANAIQPIAERQNRTDAKRSQSRDAFLEHMAEGENRKDSERAQRAQRVKSR